ncbi:hypothetical protein AJ79_01226 [Helicocarpus griseus UAMH5409]|uniref:glycogenin glucosyltransferase n=1 Tax=Helicocarpus griseus UAMH5409 TaxID=1447875 RepID=A0A2B7Y8Z3_9EURO|nr:hypothetical protein AJ79_01226 [Helicocarpus griseus UAMH5409]
MVLAHSLRDNGSKAKLVVLVTLDNLKASTIDELKTIYDDVIPINRLINRTPANLYLMDRPDLISTFSKIELWRQTQYSKIVYIDADIVALRAPDELLTLDARFAAVTDIGWPDCFNTGLMVLHPNLQDYYALLALAQRGISFDGADQGLLNMHFRKWDRLSFAYNCTPSGHYQYIPAFRHFGSTISLVHYIGAQKPWNLPRQTLPLESPYNQLLGRWWAAYDRHYRPVVEPAPQPTVRTDTTEQKAAERMPSTQVKHHTRRHSRRHDLGQPHSEEAVHEPKQSLESAHTTPEAHHAQVYTQAHIQPPAQPTSDPPEEGVHFQAHEAFQQPEEPQTREAYHVPEVSQGDDSAPILENAIHAAGRISPHPQPIIPEKSQDLVISAVPQYVRGEEHHHHHHHPHSHPGSHTSDAPSILTEKAASPPPPMADVPAPHHLPQELTEPFKQPEIGNIPAQLQEPEPPKEVPARSFSPPRAEWDASRAPPPIDSKPEAFSLPSHTYSMSQDTELFQPPTSYPEAPKDMYYQVPPKQPETRGLARIFPWESYAPKPTRVFYNGSSETDSLTESHTKLLAKESLEEPEPPLPSAPPEDPWVNYMRSNAWDEVPEIEKYMRTIQRPRRGQVQVLKTGTTTEDGAEGRRPSLRLTDFPTEIERPSLPVTPAPIRRPNFWSGARRSDEQQDSETGTGKGKGSDGSSTNDNDNLPPAAGVPSQENWNPLERLEELQRRQSAFLDEERGGTPVLGLDVEAQELPRRSMPGEDGEPGIPVRQDADAPAPAFTDPLFGSGSSRAERRGSLGEDGDIDPVNADVQSS